MHPHERLLRDCYAAFNLGRYEQIPEHMTTDVEWPDQLEGTLLRGGQAIVEYWERLAKVHRHAYEPKHFDLTAPDRVVVSLIRTVHSQSGEVISQGLIHHVYDFRNGRVCKMQIKI